MKEGPAAEVIRAEVTGEPPSTSSASKDESGTDSPWLLEWFPGFDIPIGLEGRAYLRRLLNHRRAENPTACETLLAAHGIKLGRGVPGHTSNWGSMKVRELLHAAYLLGCWSAVERLCINFCHANGLKTEWIRELKAKGGKQSVTLANLQNYRKKNREKKRPQHSDTREKKTSVLAGVSTPRPTSATASSCTGSATATTSDSTAARPLNTAVAVQTLCRQLEGEDGDEVSCSPVGSEASKESRRRSASSCDTRIPGSYVCNHLTSQQATAADSAPPAGLEYVNVVPQTGSSEAQQSIPQQDATAQEEAVGVNSKQFSLQLTLPLLHSPITSFSRTTYPCSTATDGGANIDTGGGFTAAPPLQVSEPATNLTHISKSNRTGTSSATHSNSTPLTRMRRPKRRSGKSKPSGPRKRRQTTVRTSATEVRTGSLSSMTSCEDPVAHVTRSVLPECAGPAQCVEPKLPVTNDLQFPTSIQHGVSANACDTLAETHTVCSPTPPQRQSCTTVQRALTTTAGATPAAEQLVTRPAASVPRDGSRQTFPRHTHRWFAASTFTTDSSDNGSSEPESLYSRTSTCTTTSSYSDSDHSLHEECRCSLLRAAKQVNFAGKKPAFRCMSTSCPFGEAALSSVFLSPHSAEEHMKAPSSTNVTAAPTWTEVARAPDVPQAVPTVDFEAAGSGHHQEVSYRERLNTASRSARALQGSFLPAYENKPSSPYFWDAGPHSTRATGADHRPPEVCTPDTFCGDGPTALVHSTPESVISQPFATMSTSEGNEKPARAQYVHVPLSRGATSVTEWYLPTTQTPANTGPAPVDVDAEASISTCTAWKGPPQPCRGFHEHGEGQASFDGECCTGQLQGTDVFRGYRDTLQACSGRADWMPEQLGCTANTIDRLPRVYSEPQRAYTPIGKPEDQIRDRAEHSSTVLAGDEYKSSLVNGGECYGGIGVCGGSGSSTTGFAAPAPALTERDTGGGTRDATCVYSYEGATLPCPVSCSESLANSLIPPDHYPQRTPQSITGALEVNDTSITPNSTELPYSTVEFHAQGAWVSCFGDDAGNQCAWEGNYGTKFPSACADPTHTAEVPMPMQSQGAPVMARTSPVAGVRDQPADRVGIEVCATNEVIVSTEHLPVQLPPLAQTQEHFLPRTVLVADCREDQTARWTKSSVFTADSGVVPVPAAGGPPLPAATAAAENSAVLLPKGLSETLAMSADWSGEQSSADWSAGDVFQVLPPMPFILGGASDGDTIYVLSNYDMQRNTSFDSYPQWHT